VQVAGRQSEKQPPKSQGTVNTMQLFTRALVALLSSLAAGHAAPRHHCSSTACLMNRTAAGHGWGAVEVSYEWDVLYRESRSTSRLLNRWATNGHCLGSGQLSWETPDGEYLDAVHVYEHFGGDYYTVAGQIKADLNYIVEHGYHTPGAAWAHEQSYGWY
jgi:hypothetical protein